MVSILIELTTEGFVNADKGRPAAPIEAPDRVDLIFRALASGPRREILRILATGGGKDDARCCSDDEVCACVFSERLRIGAPTVSHHMKALLDADLVSAEKRGQWVYYRLIPATFSPVIEELRAFISADRSCCSNGDS